MRIQITITTEDQLFDSLYDSVERERRRKEWEASQPRDEDRLKAFREAIKALAEMRDKARRNDD